MKFLRTNMGEIYPTIEGRTVEQFNKIYENLGLSTRILAIGDSIEELCDKWVYDNYLGEKKIVRDAKDLSIESIKRMFNNKMIENIYLAVWTAKGLRYVAKVNDKGDIESL